MASFLFLPVFPPGDLRILYGAVLGGVYGFNMYGYSGSNLKGVERILVWKVGSEVREDSLGD